MLGLIFIPAFLFPLMAGIGVAVDLLAGSQQFLYEFIYESKRGVLQDFLTAWIYSLPWSYTAGISVYFLLRYLTHGGRHMNTIILLVCVTVVGGISGWQLSGMTLPAAIFAISGFMLTLALRLFCMPRLRN